MHMILGGTYGKYGLDQMSIPREELVNLDVTIAEFIISRLEAFRDAAESYPSDLGSLEDWRAELADMLTVWAVVSEFGDLDEVDRANLHRFIDRLGHLWL